MTPDEQIDLWVKGQSIHNPDRDECCPDFSCCKPELLAPEAVRETFKSGNYKVRNRLLGEFLGRLIAKEFPNKKVYIAGLDAQRMELE